MLFKIITDYFWIRSVSSIFMVFFFLLLRKADILGIERLGMMEIHRNSLGSRRNSSGSWDLFIRPGKP